jgi:predicted TIM-barrel fold metal-dependent hydrolase
MRIDIHCHVGGRGTDLSDVGRNVYYCAKNNPHRHWLPSIIYKYVESGLKRMGADLNRDGGISTDEYFEHVYRLLVSSKEINGVVLLGLDAVYFPETGTLDERKTELWVANTFLSRKVVELNERIQKESNPEKRKKGFFFGASVNPNRKDWERELEYVLNLNHPKAVLIKWIPSVQHIDLRDKKHKEFYKALASHNMPLLCHLGLEPDFNEGINEWTLDNFRYLEKPLECGVAVIAAHCATPLFPLIYPHKDRNRIKEFYAFMKNANGDGTVRLWGDTSAMSLFTRVPFIREILETFPSAWLLHGSDFPVPLEAWPHCPWLTHNVSREEYTKISENKNAFDRDVRIKRAHGFSDFILEHAEKILRLQGPGNEFQL